MVVAPLDLAALLNAAAGYTREEVPTDRKTSQETLARARSRTWGRIPSPNQTTPGLRSPAQ